MGQLGAAYMAEHPGDPRPAVIKRVTDAVTKIRSRGGEVIFVRPPASGPVRMGEEHAFPRAAFWQPLLAATQCKGIHFEDNPATAGFNCPEWSHLSPTDAQAYTKALIRELPESFVH